MTVVSGQTETNITHLIWHEDSQRWIPAKHVTDDELGDCWEFQNGRDVADWLSDGLDTQDTARGGRP